MTVLTSLYSVDIHDCTNISVFVIIAGFDHMEKPAINNINLMAVKLCFQVFLPDDSGKYQRAVQPVISESIFDKSKICYCQASTYITQSS